MPNLPHILNARILIVDDQAANVQLLEGLLESKGYTQVSSTTDPRQVRAMHSSQPYDLILLDIQMPEMDGFQVMEALEADAQDYVPVIVLTAQPDHKLRALQAGAKDFISKPFDLLEVTTRIANMLEVRLLYKKLANYSRMLEDKVAERTAALQASEARFRNFTELAADWYWEQDAQGAFTTLWGPVQEMLGIPSARSSDAPDKRPAAQWNEAERSLLLAHVAAHQPFLDLTFSRVNADGSEQYFRVSGEPIFSPTCEYLGYRGIGVQMMEKIPVV